MNDILKSKYPFEEYLKEIHAKNYMGTDDNMPERFEDLLTNLDGDDLIEHANAFGRLLIDSFKK